MESTLIDYMKTKLKYYKAIQKDWAKYEGPNNNRCFDQIKLLKELLKESKKHKPKPTSIPTKGKLTI